MNHNAEHIRELVDRLNGYRHEYYNENNPSVSDAVYDHLYDELKRLETETGIVLSNSPTETVGYKAVSALDKVRHPIPLLSLGKTKQIGELLTFLKKKYALLMLKLDGLTVKLVYENGRLIEGSTRGDGEEGEVITHNVPAFRNVPLNIPYKGRLVVTGEGFIHKHDFTRLKDTLAYILRDWKEIQEKYKGYLGGDYFDYNLVLTLPNGRPVENRVIDKEFTKLKEKAGLPYVVFHSLRHSSTTYKLKLNHGDLKATQGDTSHAQIDMITDVYAHILDEDRKVNAQKFEATFYAKNGGNPLKDVTVPDNTNPDLTNLIAALQQSPELVSMLTQALKGKAISTT